MLIAFLVVANAKLYVKNDTPFNPKEQIIGGHLVKIKSFPHQVSISKWGKHICGGSIISPIHILTAAHCVKGEEKYLPVFRVRSGSSNRNQGGVWSEVSNIMAYGYTWNDIAIIPKQTTSL